MKILICLLSHHSSRDRLKACIDTWVGNCSDHKIIILGSKDMPDEISSMHVYKPLENETYKDLPEKIKRSFNYCLSKQWDYLVKIDDDAYLNTDKLVHFLQENNNNMLYAGQGVRFLTDEPPRTILLSNVGDELPPKKFIYYYAQGGCYVISRLALERSIDRINSSLAPRDCEDLMVGQAMHACDIPLEDRPDLFNCGYTGKGWHNMGTRKNNIHENISLIKSGYISVHKLTSRQIYRIYDQLR